MYNTRQFFSEHKRHVRAMHLLKEQNTQLRNAGIITFSKIIRFEKQK